MTDLKRLGDFALEKKIGAGGMGEVYLARQVSLDRTVAVKILPRSLAAQESFMERFQREAKAAANLIHPNVIQIYSIGVEDGVPYFAMELVEGEDLQQRARRVGRIGYQESIEVVTGVTNALACAFEKGIVHRDIKPSNIMLDRNDVVKVMDFGLAKATQDSAQMGLTQSGLIMGTPNYMSPEQAKGEPVDCRSDIYSLGVVFFELLTGKLPFAADTPAAIIYKHAFETAPPATELNPNLPPFLADVCARMLAKDPRERYANPKALLLDLNEFRQNVTYYIKGGGRRTPALGGGDVAAEANTLAYTGEGAVPAGEFRDAETMAETKSGRVVTMAEVVATQKARRWRIMALAVGAVMVLLLAVFAPPILFPQPNPNDPTGTHSTRLLGGPTKVEIPLAVLGGRLPKGTHAVLVRGGVAENKKVALEGTVLWVAQDYQLKLTRTGYKPTSIYFTAEADKGVQPPFESIALPTWELTDELRRALENGHEQRSNNNYGAALKSYEDVAVFAPDYPGLAELIVEMKARTQEQGGLWDEVSDLFEAREWKAVLDKSEPLIAEGSNFERKAEVRSVRRTAQAALDTIVERREAFRESYEAGAFDDAEREITKLARDLPETDAEPQELNNEVVAARRMADDAFGQANEGNLREALDALEVLLQVCPRFQRARDLRTRLREELGKASETGKAFSEAMTAAKSALQTGNLERALDQAEAAIRVATKGLEDEIALANAKALRSDIVHAMAKRKVVGDFRQLDSEFATGKLSKLLDRFDPAVAGLRAQVQEEFTTFASANIGLEQARHLDFAIKLDPNDEARGTLECVWELQLKFPEVEEAVPPVRGKVTTMRIRQRFGLRKSGDGWLVTSVEQLGKANVE